MDAYIHTKADSSKHITTLRRWLFGWLILTFLIQFMRDVVRSIPEISILSKAGVEIFYFCYIFCIGTATGIFLLVYGLKVKKQLATFKNVDKKHKKVIMRVRNY